MIRALLEVFGIFTLGFFIGIIFADSIVLGIVSIIGFVGGLFWYTRRK